MIFDVPASGPAVTLSGLQGAPIVSDEAGTAAPDDAQQGPEQPDDRCSRCRFEPRLSGKSGPGPGAGAASNSAAPAAAAAAAAAVMVSPRRVGGGGA